MSAAYYEVNPKDKMDWGMGKWITCDRKQIQQSTDCKWSCHLGGLKAYIEALSCLLLIAILLRHQVMSPQTKIEDIGSSSAPLCFPVFVKTIGPVHWTQVERCLGKVRYISSVFSWPDSQMSTTEAASPLYSFLATCLASVLQQLEVKCTCYLPNPVLSCFSRNMFHSGLDLIVPELIPTWCWWQSDSVGLNCL